MRIKRYFSILFLKIAVGATSAQANLNQQPPSPNPASCPDSALVADVVAIDHPMVFNRLGAQNVNWMMYALRRDVIDLKS